MHRFIACCLATMVISASGAAQPSVPAAAGAVADTSGPGTPMVHPEKTGAQIHEDLKKFLETVHSVHCKFRSFNRRDDLSNEKLMDFWYKNPLAARSVILEGDNLGGVVTINAEGKLRGKKGGVLGLIVLNLEPTDERIRGLRGKLFYEGSWHLIEKNFRSRVEEKAWKCERKPDRKVAGDLCYVIAIEGTEPETKITRDVLLVDQKTGALRERIEFEGKVKVSDSTFTDIEINPDLPDTLFYLE